MFEEIYDNVLSALSSSGFINWYGVNSRVGDTYTHTPLCTTCVCIDCKRVKELPSNLKYKVFNYEKVFHTPHYGAIDLNEL